MKYLIVIPARYASTRLPGKPLVEISGKTMLQRVHNIAKAAAKEFDCDIIVATEDKRIEDYCKTIGAKCIMTSDQCKTGTDRVCEVVEGMDTKPVFIVNLQGDAPLTPPWFIKQMIEEFEKDNTPDVITPVIHLKWDQLDKMRDAKKTTPFSGTCAIVKQNNDAIWFSKNIIPAIRKEEKYRESSEFSPVHRHVGLYGYSAKILKEYASLPESFYEKFEGLEQLRFLENGYKIRVVKVDYKGRQSSSGVDSPEDVKRTEEIINKDGELV